MTVRSYTLLLGFGAGEPERGQLSIEGLAPIELTAAEIDRCKAERDPDVAVTAIVTARTAEALLG